jgi:hypothetical protein
MLDAANVTSNISGEGRISRVGNNTDVHDLDRNKDE